MENNTITRHLTNKIMKNIHMFPTKKPSRLFMCFGKLNIGDYIAKRKHPNVENQHIYITSDEEIKEMDWFYDIRKPDIPINRRFISTIMDENYKKIILTDCSILIENGVQAIDDEFLEWFVKNPSCEEVEVKKEQINNKYGSSYSTITIYKYKIIIPKEEPKQETLEERVGKKAVEYCKKYENTFKYNDIMLAIEFGYQLAQQELYSEEEVENILIEYVKTNPTKPYRVVSWFQQFKKK